MLVQQPLYQLGHLTAVHPAIVLSLVIFIHSMHRWLLCILTLRTEAIYHSKDLLCSADVSWSPRRLSHVTMDLVFVSILYMYFLIQSRTALGLSDHLPCLLGLSSAFTTFCFVLVLSLLPFVLFLFLVAPLKGL